MATKGTRLEAAASKLGYTVTEGSIICHGRRSRPEPYDSKCEANLSYPQLASQEERAQMDELAQLDSQAKAMLTDAQAIIATQIVGTLYG